ncbi:MAG: hypothetical protein ACQESP_08595 [Candidatus Muiribacteriota bacterium]
MKNYKNKLEEIGKTFGVDIKPENVDDVLKNTWEKYHRSVRKL